MTQGSGHGFRGSIEASRHQRQLQHAKAATHVFVTALDSWFRQGQRGIQRSRIIIRRHHQQHRTTHPPPHCTVSGLKLRVCCACPFQGVVVPIRNQYANLKCVPSNFATLACWVGAGRHSGAGRTHEGKNRATHTQSDTTTQPRNCRIEHITDPRLVQSSGVLNWRILLIPKK